MANSTPGPWKMRDDREVEIMLCGIDGVSDWVHAVDDKGANVAGCYGRSYEENAANARLIAAAPDLLAALRDVLEVLEWKLHPEWDGSATPESAIGKARAAIAKATGGA
jgi:hypothetical protein